MSPTVVRVWEVLQAHAGKANGLSCFLIAKAALTSERDVRRAITELREGGVAVCGHPDAGYFIAETAKELEETCQFLRARALHSLQLESRLRKVSLQSLVGQMSLNLQITEG